jgi:hypothetical protein
MIQALRRAYRGRGSVGCSAGERGAEHEHGPPVLSRLMVLLSAGVPAGEVQSDGGRG